MPTPSFSSLSRRQTSDRPQLGCPSLVRQGSRTIGRSSGSGVERRWQGEAGPLHKQVMRPLRTFDHVQLSGAVQGLRRERMHPVHRS